MSTFAVESLELRKLLSANALPVDDEMDTAVPLAVNAVNTEASQEGTVTGPNPLVEEVTPVAAQSEGVTDLHEPIPGASSPTVVQMWEDLQSVGSHTDNPPAGAHYNSDEMGVIIRAMEERYLEAYNHDLSAVSQFMGAVDDIISRATSDAGTVSGRLDDVNKLAAILNSDGGMQELVRMLDKNLWELDNLVGIDGLREFTDNIDNITNFLNAADMVRAALNAGDPTEFLNWTSNVMAIASTFTPPGMSHFFEAYEGMINHLQDILDRIMDQLGRDNIDGLSRWNSVWERSHIPYSLGWAKNVLDNLGIDWKTEYPAAYE